MQGYTCIYNQSQDRLAQIIVLRIQEAITLENCEANPDLVAALVKLIYDGFDKLHPFIEQPETFLAHLLRIYFNYNHHLQHASPPERQDKYPYLSATIGT